MQSLYFGQKLFVNVVHLPLCVFHRKAVNQLSIEAGKEKQNKQNKHLLD